MERLCSKRAVLVPLLFLMLCTGARAGEWGLVLAGGGGKGAYQVGVWKALCEYGIAQKVTVISGTSAGGLNAALFATVTPSEAEQIWKDEVPGKLTQGDALISQEGLSDIISSVPLEKLGEGSVPQVYVTAVRDRLQILKYIDATVLGAGVGSYSYRFSLNESSEQGKRSALLATAAFPVICDSVWIDDREGGHYYSDGGQESIGGDNVPLLPIAQWHPEVSDVIVVYCSDRSHVSRRVQAKDYDGRFFVHELFPSIDTDGSGFWEGLLNGTANFSRSRIELLVRTGYDDTVRYLRQRGYFPLSSYWFD